ncbi:DUF1798 domain-containing protein [Halalkalibacillus sediminis]|uniref:DUF1798 domain-containing protein n=1 Tax=Halalkalibacillus sediminis TaxID=2018042 RepID=A0A2I0QWU3_9BACI|nr:DUF1798 family protein [Halalkalibacillus sediminis]PKR78816.1 DUF1798 domain-containing protein [Halalkalibacillus sediminis]
MEEFLRLTTELKNNILEDSIDRYLNGKKYDRKNHDDFEEIKEITIPLFERIEKWETDAQSIVHQIPLFPNQIENTKDNLEILMLHSFFHDVRKKRFMELYHSVLYNLDIILDQTNK